MGARAPGSGIALRLPFGAAVGVVANVFLLLGVDADHRLAGGQMRSRLGVDVAELAISVLGLGLGLGDLGVGLKAVADIAQQPVDEIGAGLMAQTLQLGGQSPGRLRTSSAAATSDHPASRAPPASPTPPTTRDQ